MSANVTVKNKNTGEILNTEDNGLIVTIGFKSDGEVEIESIGTCTDNSTSLAPDTTEKYFDPEDYEIVSIDI